jgi:hypothetical protein
LWIVAGSARIIAANSIPITSAKAGVVLSPTAKTAAAGPAETTTASHEQHAHDLGLLHLLALFRLESGRNGRDLFRAQHDQFCLNLRDCLGFLAHHFFIVLLADDRLHKLLLRRAEFFIQLTDFVTVSAEGLLQQFTLFLVQIEPAECAQVPTSAGVISAAHASARTRWNIARGCWIDRRRSRRLNRGGRIRTGWRIRSEKHRRVQQSTRDKGSGDTSESGNCNLHNCFFVTAQKVQTGRLRCGYIDVTLPCHLDSAERMRGDIDLRELDLKKLRLSRRRWMVVLAVAALIAGSYFGWRSITHPPRPWLVRWQLNRYLARQAHTSDFKINFAFPPKSETASADKKEEDKGPMRGSRTGKDFETLREEYLAEKTTILSLQQIVARSEAELSEAKRRLAALTAELAQPDSDAQKASVVESNLTLLREKIASDEKTVARRSELEAKENAITPVVEDLWEFQRTWIADTATSDSVVKGALAKARSELIQESDRQLNTASSYEVMYQTIGRELFVARRLLDSANREHRREAVNIALAATRQAMNYVMNGAVAARICEGYILPNLDLATDRNTRSVFNEQNLLRQCADIFRRNEEPNNVVRTYELYLASATNPASKDWARSQIFMAYEQAGDAKRALATWREIKDTNSFRFLMRRLPRLEQEAKVQR